MYKKYIDQLTISEYKFIENQLKKRLEEEKKEMEKSGNTKNYVELRFILLKIKKIIEKYQKNTWQKRKNLV